MVYLSEVLKQVDSCGLDMDESNGDITLSLPHGLSDTLEKVADALGNSIAVSRVGGAACIVLNAAEVDRSLPTPDEVLPVDPTGRDRAVLQRVHAIARYLRDTEFSHGMPYIMVAMPVIDNDGWVGDTLVDDILKAFEVAGWDADYDGRRGDFLFSRPGSHDKD